MMPDTHASLPKKDLSSLVAIIPFPVHAASVSWISKTNFRGVPRMTSFGWSWNVVPIHVTRLLASLSLVHGDLYAESCQDVQEFRQLQVAQLLAPSDHEGYIVNVDLALPRCWMEQRLHQSPYGCTQSPHDKWGPLEAKKHSTQRMALPCSIPGLMQCFSSCAWTPKRQNAS